ncbi:MAG: hypothetical protein DCC55_37450 [Chloroflexi bacterium]|nr:MAG: hypothetical protein DCC55_37450 [Chloroflexota bacterium]
MVADNLIQPLHHADVARHQTSDTFLAAPFTQVRCDRDSLRFTHLRVPQRGRPLGPFPFTELPSAASTAQRPDALFAIHFAHRQIAFSRLTIQFATWLDTC